MNDFDRIQREIALDERWLAEVCEAEAPFDTAGIKRTIALAAREAWLARQDVEHGSRALSTRIKSRLRVEAARSRRRPRRWSLWLAGASGIAAMVTIGVISFEKEGGQKIESAVPSGFVAAFGSLDDFDADFDAELSSLKEALGSLDGLRASDTDETDWSSDWTSDWDDSGSGT